MTHDQRGGNRHLSLVRWKLSAQHPPLSLSGSVVPKIGSASNRMSPFITQQFWWGLRERKGTELCTCRHFGKTSAYRIHRVINLKRRPSATLLEWQHPGGCHTQRAIRTTIALQKW